MTNRAVVLTGAAGGLGRAMALGLASAGHDIAITDLDEGGLVETAELARQCRPAGHVVPLVANLADPAQLRRLVADAEAALGRIDVLINNAGLGIDHIRRDFLQRPVRFWEVEPEQADRVFRVNGLAPFLLAREVVPGMLARGFGRIVNVTTSLDTMMRPGFAPYGGTKASLEAHSAIMAGDLAGSGVTVNVLIPGGPADTGMIPHEAGFDRRRLIRPDVMVPPLLWLMSDEGGGITGRRFIAAAWDKTRTGSQASDAASAPVAWPDVGAQTRWPDGAAPQATIN